MEVVECVLRELYHPSEFLSSKIQRHVPIPLQYVTRMHSILQTGNEEEEGEEGWKEKEE